LRLFAVFQAAWLVVHAAGGLAEVHRAVLVTVVDGDPWGIDRQLQCIGTQAVHLGVGVGKHPALQQAVFRRFDAGHKVGRGHGDLLGFLEHVRRIAVQHHLPDFAFRHVRPDLGGVQRIELKLGQVFGLEHLHIQVPLGEVAFVDMGDQVVSHMAVITTLHFGDLLWIKVLNALQALPVELDVMHFAFGINQFVGMYAITVHFPITGGRARVRIQLGQRARGLGYM